MDTTSQDPGDAGVPPNKDTKRSGKPQLRGPNPPQPPLEPPASVMPLTAISPHNAGHSSRSAAEKRPVSATFTERGIAAGVVSDNTEPTVTLVDGTQAAEAPQLKILASTYDNTEPGTLATEAPRLRNSVYTYSADS
ncbi:hypothetical protein Bbelb_357710 [Branchiostoma belcheri]|nr:hypothetical protein Bbelb_357710 [Branchiostoma belcheri]